MGVTTYGQLTVDATDAQLALILPTVSQIDAVFGPRVDPLTLRFVPLSTMPEYVPGKKARGYFSDGNRLIRLADSLDYPVEKTCGHELCHWLIADHFIKWHRRSILPLVKPTADGWGDHTINGVFDAYRNDVNEAVTVYLSAALFGYDKPAFTTIYGYRIDAVDWPQLGTIALAEAPTTTSTVDALRTELQLAKSRTVRLEQAIVTTRGVLIESADRLTNAVDPGA